MKIVRYLVILRFDTPIYCFMTRLFITIVLSTMCAMLSRGAGIRFEGASLSQISIAPEAGTGLDGIYVLYDTSGVRLVYTAASATASVECYTYGVRGAAYPEAVPESDISRQGADIIINPVAADCGYAFNENGHTTYFWVSDYSAHPYNVNAIIIDSEQSCDLASLSIDGTAARMTYYSITGRQYEIDRQISLDYTSLVADMDNFRYISTPVSQQLPHIAGSIHPQAPLCDTYFHLSGDRFLRQWGMEQETTSPHYTTPAISAEISVTQNKRDSANEIKSDEALGGSAPAEIRFAAMTTDAVVFTQWQFATDPEFEDIYFQTPDLEYTYTFTDMGTTYVRFIASNATGTCDYYSEVFTVYIGESQLLCPNAFSPGASEGVNDEWRVSYKSIVDFECYIFNRWGQKMAELHDPSQGWDGKHGGRLVPAGVYYYVIKARGSDGKKYNLSGDINILKYNR